VSTLSLLHPPLCDRDLAEKMIATGAEIGKKVDSLGEVLLIKNLPENERKMVIVFLLFIRLCTFPFVLLGGVRFTTSQCFSFRD
jgi:hypothetical protein